MTTLERPRIEAVEFIPRMNPYGVFTQLDASGNYVGRTVPRLEAEANRGNIAAVSVLLFDGFGEGGNVLLQKRASTKKRWPGLWEGSVVETVQMRLGDPLNPESPQQTAVRGVKEELGVRIDPDSLRRQTYYRFTDIDPVTDQSTTTSHVIVFAAESPHGLVFSPDPQEVEAINWVPVAEILPGRSGLPRTREFAPGFEEFVTAHRSFFQ